MANDRHLRSRATVINGNEVLAPEFRLGALLRATGFAGVKSWTGEIYLKNFTDLL